MSEEMVGFDRAFNQGVVSGLELARMKISEIKKSTDFVYSNESAGILVLNLLDKKLKELIESSAR